MSMGVRVGTGSFEEKSQGNEWFENWKDHLSGYWSHQKLWSEPGSELWREDGGGVVLAWLEQKEEVDGIVWWQELMTLTKDTGLVSGRARF